MLLIEADLTDIEVNVGLDIESLAPSIRRAELKYLRPVLGELLYSNLLDWYGESPTSNAAFESIHPYVKPALLNLSIYLWIDRGQVNISSSGIHQLDTSDSEKPDWWVIKDLKRSFFEAGLEAVDELLKFLEENEDDYPDWVNSEGYTNLYDLFIQSASQLNEIHDIGNSRFVYLIMRPVIRRIEDMYIEPRIGSEFFNQLKSAMKSPSPDQQKVIELLRSAIGHLAFSQAITDTNVMFDGGAVTVAFKDTVGVKRRELETERQTTFKKQRHDYGHVYLNKAIKHLNVNADDYPTWKESEKYQDPETHVTRGLANGEGKIIGL